MRQRHGWLGRTACLLLAAVLLAQPALAFYPLGFFRGGELILLRWPFEVMDVDGDNDISGPFDGVPLQFETGTGGFTEQQIQRLFAGYEEWERVGTSFAAFSRGPNITDTVELTSGFDQIDGINAVAFQSATDPVIAAPESIGLTLYTFSTDPISVSIGGVPVLFTEAQLIDVDTVFTQNVLALDAVLVSGLEAEGTFAGGRTLGLNDATLFNITDSAGASGFPEEVEVITLRNFQGILEPRGTTSSMVNLIAAVDRGNGVFEHAAHDLAPDDIAGITYLYPRQDADLFFNLVGYARTRSTTQIPSQPIAGAWIRAYVNANNTANRVPMYDTFTGFFTPEINPNDRHRFQFVNMLKQMETPNGVTFSPNYTLTCAEFTPVTNFIPGTLDTRTELDTLHGFASGNYTGFGFDSLFLSEVFNESGNIVGQQNVSQGTPLKFDIIRREVVSTLSGLSYLEIVGPDRIVFGDDGVGASPQTGCPFNQVLTIPATTAGGGPSAPAALRTFRDSVLLQSAVGAALTDLYYRVSPSLAALVERNAIARQLFVGGVSLFEGALANIVLVLLALAGSSFALAAARSRRRFAVATAAVLAVALAAVWTATADAKSLPRSLADDVAASDYIVQGSVESVNSYMVDDGTRIVTDVTVRVEDSVKGRLNKSSYIHFRLPTGRVGSLVRVSPDLPTFVEGEESVLFFKDYAQDGLHIVGGTRGKYTVRETPAGTKYVGVASPGPQPHLRAAAAEMKALREGRSADSESGEDGDGADASDDGPITVEEFKDYLRYLDRENRRNE